MEVGAGSGSKTLAVRWAGFGMAAGCGNMCRRGHTTFPKEGPKQTFRTQISVLALTLAS